MSAKIQAFNEKSNTQIKKIETFLIPTNPLERMYFPLSIVKGSDPKIIKHTTFDELLQALKSEKDTDLTNVQKSKSLVSFYKTNKTAYNELKESLYGFVIGKFRYRKNEDCTIYVPVLCFDIDSIDFTDLILKDCKSVPYVFAAFPSPSGYGLRVLVWCNSTPETHKSYYDSVITDLSERLNIPTDKQLKAQKTALKDKPHFDSSTSNIARLWYIAAVPSTDIYLNITSEVYTLPVAPVATTTEIERPIERPQHTERNKTSYSEGEPVFSLSEKIALAERMVKDRNITGGRNNTFFCLACLLNEMNVPESDILQYGSTYIQDDFNQAEITKTVKSAIKTSQKGKFSDLQLIKYRNNGQSTPGISLSDRNNRSQEQPKSEVIQIIRPESKAVESNIVEIESDCLSIEGNTYQWTTDKGTVQISNFIIKPMYLLKDNRNPKRIFEIVNKYNESAIVCVLVKDLTNDGFTAIVEGKGNYIPDWSRKQFNAIKATIYNLEKQAQEITVLGYQHDTGLYVFANGIFDGKAFHYVNDYGIVTCEKGTFFIPAFSKINEDAKTEFDQERKFLFRESDIDFNTWSTQFCKVYANNGKIALSYLIVALFSDVTYNHVSSFPLLFLFGQKSTGKTAIYKSIQEVFGVPQTAPSLEGASSPKGFLRTLAHFVNGIIVFEEYKNHIDKFLIGMLKNVYDRIGYVRAQMSNDNKTHSSPVASALIVAGQELPTKEAALFTRVVLLEFTQEIRSDEEKFQQSILYTLENKGLGNVLCSILSHRKTFEKQYKTTFDSIYKQLKYEANLKGVAERSIKNCVVVLAPIKILSSVLALPFTYDEVYKILCTELERQNKIMARNSEINQFWNIFETLCNNQTLTKKHYKVEEKDGVLTLYIHFETVFIAYNDHVIKQRLNGLDKETLRQYLKVQSYCIKAKGTEDTFPVRLELGQKRCLAFNYKALDIELESIVL